MHLTFYFLAHGSSILLKCINNNTCPLNVTKQHSYVCLCTSGVCAKIRCRGTYTTTPLKIKCKIETQPKDALDCLSYPVIEQLSGKATYMPYTSVKIIIFLL